jgi:hypothetical protein
VQVEARPLEVLDVQAVCAVELLGDRVTVDRYRIGDRMIEGQEAALQVVAGLGEIFGAGPCLGAR